MYTIETYSAPDYDRRLGDENAPYNGETDIKGVVVRISPPISFTQEAIEKAFVRGHVANPRPGQGATYIRRALYIGASNERSVIYAEPQSRLSSREDVERMLGETRERAEQLLSLFGITQVEHKSVVLPPNALISEDPIYTNVERSIY